MTGFARAEGEHVGQRWIWELKSVNGRGLDLKLRLPPGFDAGAAGAPGDERQVQTRLVAGRSISRARRRLAVNRSRLVERSQASERLGRVAKPSGTAAGVRGVVQSGASSKVKRSAWRSRRR
jgi:hypothetical protein